MKPAHGFPVGVQQWPVESHSSTPVHVPDAQQGFVPVPHGVQDPPRHTVFVELQLNPGPTHDP